ncbi:hypothetical protein L1F30_12475 [Simiduia sp. 21SJ11W-1]|uniref:hypothetical protein n=1 Tax=Simiduia sp. 21SJ11W-1 TaxID=2909669 RepID=UPI0020A0DCC6|nr:hypothetical protein [Simiduia sp. 21SJ11W-1]UTA46977.1 hypothetical protein L1F30_12475 [Simiduia sp. 21SJ11W-1]
MQVWEISPAYLNDAELHAQRVRVEALLTGAQDAAGASWLQHREALHCVAAWLEAETELRGLPQSEVLPKVAPTVYAWPKLQAPADIFGRLKASERNAGRIPLPNSTQSLWTQHKYSVAARSMAAYREISVKVAASRGRENFDWLAGEVCKQLRLVPEQQSLRDALLQMWGYVASAGAVTPRMFDDLPALLAEIQRRANGMNVPYLTHATALSELRVWLA